MPPRSPPAMIVDLLGHRRDDRVASVSGSNSLDDASSMPATCRAYSITMHCRPRHRPEGRDALLARELQRAELALDAADAEAAGHDDAVESAEGLRRRPRASRTGRTGSSVIVTWVSCANPPALSASVTER